MQKLFLAALIAGVCMPAIKAQEIVRTGIYGGLQNLRFHAPGMKKQDAPPTADSDVPQTNRLAVNGAIHDLRFDAVETGKKYADKAALNSRAASGGTGGRFQCPPGCPEDYNRFEIYGGYSYLSHEIRVFSFFDDDINGLNGFNFFDDDLRARFGLQGADFSFTFNFSRYVGAQFDFSTHRRTFDDFDVDFAVTDGIDVFGTVDRAKFRISNFLFGVQFKDNLEGGYRVRPFGHFLLGFSRQRLKLESLTFTADFDNDGDIDIINLNDDDVRFRKTSFALAMGGGLDVRITDAFSIRAIKFDYLPVFARRPVLFLDPPTILDPDFDFFFVDIDGERKTQHNFRVGAGVVFHF
ncbi:MAG TPA: hypothetical protein VIM99_05295 [Blastocatellia bacterium]